MTNKEFYQKRKNYHREYRERPENRERHKNWCKENWWKYAKSHKRSHKGYLKEYYQKNKERINQRMNKYFKQRRKTDIKFRLNCNISSRISDALNREKAGRKWQTLVGYTLEDLINHLEKQFDNKMSWNNYGSWEIDHIKPQSLFHYIYPEDPEFKKCWALSNLQPMEKIANRRKGNKYEK